ncbi:MAG: protein kinase [Planctomycetes bacterium]|nr:protein kinase [Planctomycetota bacterium]
MPRHRALQGTTLGGCRIDGFLGMGGMAAVYRAEQLGLERLVAVKVLSQQLTRDPKQVEQFMREARALAKVEHPNIVRIYGVGQEEGLHFLVVQLVAAGSLRDLLERDGRLSTERAFKAARELCLGLGAAHKAGIVHRDVKPDNILVGSDGALLLTDFGLARMADDPTQSMGGRIQGTPHYIPPEQVDGRPVDARADLYSLGATLYHALTGAPPFEAKSAYELILKHVGEPIVPPHERCDEVPEPLSRVVCRLLEKDPQDRYPDTEAVLAALAAAEAPDAAPSSAATPPPERDAPLSPTLLLTPELPPLELPPAPLPAARGRGVLALAGLAFVGVLALGWPDLQLAFAASAGPSAALARRALQRLDAAGAAPADALAELAALQEALPGEPALRERATELQAKLDAAARPTVERAQALLRAGEVGPALDALRTLPPTLGADVEREVQSLIHDAETRLEETDFAWIPGGKAPSGEGALAVERDLAGCYLKRREVTRREYAEVALKRGLYLPWGEGAPAPEEAELPVVGLSLRDAARYAAAVGCRLPTAWEWERAARGAAGQRWPWGDTPREDVCNLAAAGGTLRPPGAFPADLSPIGCLDMGGNAAELTLAPNHSSRAPRGWLRGGSILTRYVDNARGAFYLEVEVDERHSNCGLRLAADALPEVGK